MPNARGTGEGPALALARDFAPDASALAKHCKRADLPLPPVGWWMSEKLRGVRASWDGQVMRTRSDRPIQLPEGWASALPPTPLDGELMATHGGQDATTGLIRMSAASPAEWAQRGVRFHAFGTFGGSDAAARMQAVRQAVGAARRLRADGVPDWVEAVPHTMCESEVHFDRALEEVLGRGGEGVMLLAAKGGYPAGRTWSLLKVKGEDTDTFEVLAEVAGKGRAKGRVPSVLVRRRVDGVECHASVQPPAEPGTFRAGQAVTVRYMGVTSHGVPINPRVNQ